MPFDFEQRLTIRLTSEQQDQIAEAVGTTPSVLVIEAGQLQELALPGCHWRFRSAEMPAPPGQNSRD